MYIFLQRPPFLPPPIGNLPPPPGMLFPPGMPPVPSSGSPTLNPTEEIWVENKTSEGKVRWEAVVCSYQDPPLFSSLKVITSLPLSSFTGGCLQKTNYQQPKIDSDLVRVRNLLPCFNL